MSLFDRLWQVLHSNLSNITQEEADPEKLIEATIEELEQQLITQRQSIAQAIAIQKRTERQIKQLQMHGEEWYRRAKLALVHNQEQLARESLTRRQSYLEQIKSLETQTTAQIKIVNELREQLRLLEVKVNDLKLKKDLYIARFRSANISQKLADINYSSTLENIEQKLREIEAEAELNTDPLEAKFKDLETEEIKKLKSDLENI